MTQVRVQKIKQILFKYKYWDVLKNIYTNDNIFFLHNSVSFSLAKSVYCKTNYHIIENQQNISDIHKSDTQSRLLIFNFQYETKF